MICPPDWSGFKEMEVAQRPGCVSNCIYNPSNVSDPEGKKRQAIPTARPRDGSVTRCHKRYTIEA